MFRRGLHAGIREAVRGVTCTRRRGPAHVLGERGTLSNMRVRVLVFSIVPLVTCMAQQPRVPDIEVQRAAMKKLGFLVGKWTGEACILRGPGAPEVLIQTEEAQYKLDGLILVTEGVGRT